MRPSIELRLQTMIKAMTELVLPAIDPTNSAAVEQANLVAASLDLLREQVDYGHWFAVTDIYSHAELLNSLVNLSSLTLDTLQTKVVNEAEAIAQRWDVTQTVIENHGQLLREVAAAFIERIAACQNADLLNQTTKIILDHSALQISRERAFVAKTNFDVYPETLNSLSDVLPSSSLNLAAQLK